MSTELPSLAARLEKDGPLPWREAARLGARVARLLDRLHARGAAHGGIEPLTVLFVGGAVRLADPLPPERRHPAFVAREMLQGVAANRQTDFFALGRLIQAMLVADLHALEIEPAAESHAPALPPPLAAVVSRLLGRGGDDGYQSGNDVAAALELAVAASDAYEQPAPATHAPAPALRPSPAAGAAAPASRHRSSASSRHRGLVLGLLALLIGGGLVVLVLWPHHDIVIEEPRSPSALDDAAVAPPPDPAVSLDAAAADEVAVDEATGDPLPSIEETAEGERLRALMADVRRRPCTRLEVETGPQGLQLRGNVASSADRLEVLAAIEQANLAADVRVGIVASATLCRLYDLLAANSEMAMPRFAGLFPARGSQRLSEADPLIVEVLTPGFRSHLTVDYFAADGMVVHLTAGPDGTGALPPGEVVKIGDPRNGHWLSIAPPFGDEVVLALVSAEPLFTAARPMIEPAQSYLEALEAALRQQSTRPLASTIAIRTRPMGLRHAAP